MTAPHDVFPVYGTRVAALVLLVLAACSSDPAPIENNRPADMGGTKADVRVDAARDASLRRIEVEPSDVVLQKDTTEALTARGFDANDNEVTLAGLVWSSSDEAVADVASSGTVIGVDFGTATITVSLGEVSADASVRVVGAPVASVEVSPRNRTMTVGDTVQMNVSLFDANNAPIEDERPVSFSSADGAVVTVDAAGLVAATGPGMTAVTTTVEGFTVDSDFTVTEPVGVDSVVVSPAVATVARLATVQLSASATAAGVAIPAASFTWSSDDPSVADVDVTGLVTGVGEGTTTVRATAEGVDGQASIDVTFDFGSIAAGGAHACALSGQVAYCWGDNGANQLGRANVSDTAAAPVETSLRFDRIATGESHSCGIAADTKTYCWGRGTEGQLGHAMATSSAQPVEVFGNHTFVAIAGGDRHTCAVDDLGAAWCWGSSSKGQIGVAGAGAGVMQPQNPGSFRFVGPGGEHTCAIDASNVAFCWGDNSVGQVGVNVAGSTYTSPTAVVGGFAFDNIAAGSRHNCGSTTSGALVCWGSNSAGQLGDGTNIDRPSPVLISSPVPLSRATSGGEHSCALSGSGAAYCWGSNSVGQLGLGAAGGGTVDPAPAQTALTFASIVAGRDFTCTLTVDGEPVCWGAGPGGGAAAPTSVPF